MPSVKELESLANKLRRHVLIMTSNAGSGHLTSCLSCAEIFSVLFFHEMHFDPSNPHIRNCDTFILSKGHAAPVLYAALKEAGAIDDDLLSLRKFKSKLEGHPSSRLEWVKIATGSLGQGLSAGCGMAYGRKLDNLDGRIYVLLGDGETAEGAVWEAVQFATHYKLDNLCAVIDVNALGQSGPTLHKHSTEIFVEKFSAFGWQPFAVDGHNVRDLISAFEEARTMSEKPSVIIAKTIKGKGVSFLEGLEGWHGKALEKGAMLEEALAQIESENVSLKPQKRIYPDKPMQATLPIASAPGISANYKLSDKVATREAYGNALAKLGQLNPHIVVLDGDTKNSTYAEKFKMAHPERYIEAYIAEQNMVGVSLGLSCEGKIPFASSFACFLTRAFDFIRMAVYSRPKHLILCGSHAGVSIGEDGASQMGLEDIAMMRSFFGSTVLYPCDAVSTEKIVEQAIKQPGIVYIRTTRPKTPVIYSDNENFTIGGSKILRSSSKDSVTLVAAGITVLEALRAYDLLKEKGISARVIDAYSIKPLDAKTIQKAAKETGFIVTVEDHVIYGGLFEAVQHETSGLCKVIPLGITEIPLSGSPSELMNYHGLSADSIVKTVLSQLGPDRNQGRM